MEEESKEILEKINSLHESLTEESLKNASKEDVFEYLRLVDELKAMLITTIDLQEDDK